MFCLRKGSRPPLPLWLMACVALVVTGTATMAAADPVFTVFMSASGADTNDGLTAVTAVRSLVRVQEVLVEHNPATDVEVRIAQGTYVAPPMHSWRFYVPEHTISFLPIDYEYGEGREGIAGLPVFRNARNADGMYPGGYWLQPRLPTDPTHPLYGGGTSGLRFYYLQVEYYSSGGVSVYGDSERDVEDERYSPPLRVRGSVGLNGNTFFGMVFTRLGNRWATDTAYGYGGIVLTNSSSNRIENNHFVQIENASPYGGKIHGLYITHFSSQNSIRRNRFSYNSGDPVKIRNQSNFNAVEYNSFTRSGRNSFYRDEFCDEQCAIDNNGSRQCASYHNRFFYNVLISDYDGDNSSESWTLSPPGLTYAGEAPCSIPAGDQRLRTGGNSQSPPPPSCPEGETCCEPGPNDTCHLCWPANNPCP
jgi:Right handed beta helix region